ncbi:MAG TPA: AbrB/MazE/SpoVT family DNA-binding domain-containing protein [Candidatus Bathyarchaeia archaeon]|nr:AbrB/MazE/SpoVT family DNA-binding domain-containing protein [Candidatus Bathyarchaeia archaeon]
MVTIEDEVTVTRIGNSLRVVIPTAITRALKIAEGQKLHMETTDGGILLLPLNGRKKKP